MYSARAVWTPVVPDYPRTMDAFVDFHYVAHSGGNFFINEMCMIIFSKETRAPVYNLHSTFKYPNLELDQKFTTTYNYTRNRCHGLDYNVGDLHWTRVGDFIEPLAHCGTVYVRGSVKCKILLGKLREMMGANHPPVYNITTRIANVLAANGVERNGENLPGYVTYDEIKSKYNNSLCCSAHARGIDSRRLCIITQCVSTFDWFIDNYYSIM